jgi:hypothetical protein
MIAIIACILAFVICFWAGRRSLGQALIALLAVGYFYGILRANLLTTFSHFIFDAGLLGTYLSQKWSSDDPQEARRLHAIQLWVILLMAWPVLLVALPFQTLLISLVGLRGAILFIPILLLGSRMKEKDLIELSIGIAVLDLVAFLFAGAEYFIGVPRFFPYSPVTRIIYASGDIVGGFFRIPAIFSSSAAFGGTMASTMPYLIGLWGQGTTRGVRALAVVAMVAALLGVLMSASRTSFIVGGIMVVVTILTTKMSGKSRLFFILVILAVGYAATTNDRFGRFKSLGDADAVTERIAGSVNRGFWEILLEYPMGNGLGGGGTSIPFFLEGQVRNPIGMENEYARILCEQGIIGLLLWLAFIFWYLTRMRCAFAKGPWSNTRRMAFSLVAFSLATAFMGTGLLTAIPGTVIMLVAAGFTATPFRGVPESANIKRVKFLRVRHSQPAYPVHRIKTQA